MKLRIERIGIRREAMWGVLVLEGVDIAYTGEHAAKRIPAGTYKIKRDTTGRWQWWRMYGNGVNDGIEGHEDVEFHPMNWPRIQSRACIGLGRMLGFIRPPSEDRSEQALYESKPAHNALLQVLGDDEHELEIVEPPPA